MNKYFLILSILFGLTSCNSSNKENNSIENQIIGTWLSSECTTYLNVKEDSKSQNLQYKFTSDTVTDTWNYYSDSSCLNFIGNAYLLSPLKKNEIIKSDTGESVLHLEWVYYYEDGTVTETNLSVYVEGQTLYFGSIEGEENNISSTVRFNTPFYKQEN